MSVDYYYFNFGVRTDALPRLEQAWCPATMSPDLGPACARHAYKSSVGFLATGYMASSYSPMAMPEQQTHGMIPAISALLEAMSTFSDGRKVIHMRTIGGRA